jgi:hypothetical protein
MCQKALVVQPKTRGLFGDICIERRAGKHSGKKERQLI